MEGSGIVVSRIDASSIEGSGIVVSGIDASSIEGSGIVVFGIIGSSVEDGTVDERFSISLAFEFTAAFNCSESDSC